MIAAPATDGRNVVNRKNAFNADIIEVLEGNYHSAVKNVAAFSNNFKGRTDEETARNVWNFLKKNIRYKRDPEHRQLIRMPGRFINDAEGDCKSFSLTACSILSNLGFKTSFRYTSYNSNRIPTHVYCIAEKNGKKFIVDGVYHQFNSEKPYTHKTDHVMNIETLSGINGTSRKAMDINNRQHLQNVFNRLRDKNTLVAMVIQKRLSGNTQRMPYTPEQLNRYKMRLQNRISSASIPFVKALLQDELNQVNNGTVKGGIFGTAEDHTIGKLKLGKRIKAGLKKVGKGLKKIGMAPSRNAFLALVRLNVKNLARKLASADQNKLKSKWEKLGGSYSALKNAFSAGSKKKAIGGEEGNETSINALPQIAATLAAAAPVIAALAMFFKKREPGETTGDSTTDSLLNTFDTLKTAAIDAGVLPTTMSNADNAANEIVEGKAEVADNESGIGTPLLIGGAALAAFVLMKK